MFDKLARLCAVLLLTATLPACATITSGSTASISVLTEPAGATCTLQRDGTVIGVVNPTPGTVQVSRSSRDIAIRCTRPGHSPGVSTVASQIQPMTAGNLLIGGVIGLAVDAASGAMSRYPENVVLTLPPETFAGTVSRDDFFSTQIAGTRRSYDERIAVVSGRCGRDNRELCDLQVQALERERDEELARLERLRQGARLGT
jgi:hypothetical protein